MTLITEQYIFAGQNNSRYTVNPEVFARILFSRIALKDIFAMLKIRD